MRSHPFRSLPVAALGFAALAVFPTLALAGCSSGGGEQATSSPNATSMSAEASAEAGTGQNPIGISPDGVTTRVDVPAESTEEQYAKACQAAKEWMAARGGDPKTLFEPLLKELQNSTQSGPATFNSTWAQLSDAQRSAVIVAVQAASDSACG